MKDILINMTEFEVYKDYSKIDKYLCQGVNLINENTGSIQKCFNLSYQNKWNKKSNIFFNNKQTKQLLNALQEWNLDIENQEIENKFNNKI